MKRRAKPKVEPWPDSTFVLKTKWEDWVTDRHFWVYLERRAAGKFGRLEAMHAIVPKGRRERETDSLFGSVRYRQRTLDATRDLFRQAGVPDDQAERFMGLITKEFSYPTPQETFEEQISSPMLKMALGERSQELSYHRTGVPELTGEDQALIRECRQAFQTRILKDPVEGQKFLDLMLGRGLL
jgi:hypothetical protein